MSHSRLFTFRAEVCATALLAVFALAPGAVGSAQAQSQVDGRFERTLKVSGAADVSVATGSGSINVRPGSDGSVHVVGLIHVSERWRRGDVMSRVHEIEQHPPIEQEGSRVRIGERDHHDDDHLFDGISVSYEVTVPAATTLTASSGSGSQEIGALTGPVHASSGSGSLHIGATGGAVRASTGSGGITVDGAKDRVEANTGSGEITLRQIAGAAKASSGSGSIELEQTAKGSAELSTASGEIRARGVNGGLSAETASGSIQISGKPETSWTLSSVSGTVSINMPTGTGFTLEAHTLSGSIDVDQPVTVSSMHGRRKEIHGAVNGGGPTLSVHTTSGSIHIGEGR
jgi:DUF4097 and DUF4098 domain-containing protein YvlB